MLSKGQKELLDRGAALFSKKGTLDSFYQAIAEQFYPERADFTRTHSWGEEFGTDLFDSTPVLCRRDLGNAFSSMLRPRGQPWFKCVDPDEELMENPDVAGWYDQMTTVGRRFIYAPKSGFVRATKEGDHDFASFGNAVLSAEVNRAKDGLQFRCWHLRDCAWAESVDGPVDSLFRKMRMSARQMRQMFTEDKLHQSVKDALTKLPDTEFDVWHVMIPADDYDGKPKGKRLPFVSIYFDTSNQHLLREAWAHEFRYVVPRWQTISGSQYAVSPAVTVALADARGMQTMARVLLEAGEKSVDPPMKAMTDKIRGDINLYAGGITVIDSEYDQKLGDPLAPLMNGRQDIPLGLQMLMRSTMQMKDAWYLSNLKLPGQAKTAYETAQLVEEYVRANIPLFEPLETEYNAAILELTYSILIREKTFDYRRAPKELSGAEFEFSFSNPLQDAIERNKVNQATTIFGATAAAAQIDPNAAKTVDAVTMLRDVVRGTGAPSKWLMPEQEADEAIEGNNQMGDILASLNGAGQAAAVVDQGAEAAMKLQQTGLIPGPDQMAGALQ